MKKIIKTAFIYLVFSVVFEVTMAAIIEMKNIAENVGNIAVRPMGLTIHTHLLVLGFFFFVIITLLEKVFSITKQKPYRLFFETYNVGLLVSIIIIAYRSFGEIFGYTVNKMLATGLGTFAHISVTVGLFAFFVCLKRAALEH